MERTNWHQQHLGERSFGDRIADRVAVGVGSWTFIIVQSVLVAAWVSLNVVGWINHWDPYPFILLNLLFSLQAAYTAPVIMMSQNRQAERDRYQAEADYATNVKSEVEIEALQQALARIEIEKLDRILAILEAATPSEDGAPVT